MKFKRKSHEYQELKRIGQINGKKGQINGNYDKILII